MSGINKIFIDTNILIYFLEKNRDLFEKSKDFFKICDDNKIQIWVSSLSIAEFLVWVYWKWKSDSDLFDLLENLGIQIHALDLKEAKKTARLRSLFNEKLPDLVHIACAIENWYEYFLSNDQNLKKVIDISAISLEEFLSKV